MMTAVTRQIMTRLNAAPAIDPLPKIYGKIFDNNAGTGIDLAPEFVDLAH